MTIASIFLLHATKGSWVRESGLLRYLSGKVAAGIFVFLITAGPPFLLLRMKAEDRALQRQFGDRWDTWEARVRYMIIPGIL
jgi:protein-S-isoprenylcysteine O-methyltransferase Ste14